MESEKAYAIVDVSKATAPQYTFAHELAHIQATQHNPETNPKDPNAIYSYAYGHNISYSCGFLGLGNCHKSTIMSFEHDRIKYFSTPYTNYQGKALGIVNDRDNRRAMNNTRNTVSNFRDANEPGAAISYTAGTISQYGQNYTFADNTCGGSGSFSYQWRKSYESPTNFGSVQSTSPSWFVALSPGTWYVKLTVNTSTGQSSSKVVSVQVEEEEECEPPIVCGGPGGPTPKVVAPGSEEDDSKPESIALLPAYPNPFNPATQIAFELPESQHVTLAVFDLTGRELSVLTDQAFMAGRHQVNFNAAELSSGIYLVRMQAGEFVQTQTVTLVK